MKYPGDYGPRKVVLQLRVNIGRVIKITHQNHPLQKTWHVHGYDTAWVPPNTMNLSGQEQDCVYDSKRIKVVDIVHGNPDDVRELNGDQPEDEKIYVMYHGTTYSAAVKILQTGFQQSADGMLGKGVYVSRDLGKAKRYPLGDKRDQVVLKLRVNVGKVKKIDYQGHPMQKTWERNGYDTAWVPPYNTMVESRLEEDCVWDPQRIKVVDIVSAPTEQHLRNLYKLL
ncbi:uncharacterized protein [Dendropsophus ebraccatus]|uniref:uncharacterized protein n=1 Tax=Dendropsophus ebraccatus TaxID=150705 RepID=UPI0038316FF2